MHPIRKILCVVEPEQTDSPAIKRAAWLAKATGAELDLLTVHYNEILLGDSHHSQSTLEKFRAGAVENVRQKILRIAEHLQTEFQITVRASAVWDHPLHEGIVRFARESDADIVLKDAHYHSALRVAMLSNQDWQLIRCCEQPLWIVKRESLPGRIRFIAAVDPLHRNDKPAALDDTILLLGKTLATATHGELHAFHSFDPRIAMSTAENNVYIPVSLPLSDIEEQMREKHEQRFEQVVDPYDIARANQHLVTGLAEEELPRLAGQLEATAVVMGAIARNALKRIFIGATAERSLNRLPSDLIVVKPDWFESSVDQHRYGAPTYLSSSAAKAIT